jgi:hypothetical protein
MLSRSFLLCVVFLTTLQLSAQFRYDNRNYPDNYVDVNGRKQGLWIIKDADSVLINKIRYKNNVSDSTVYFKKNGEAIILMEPDSMAYVTNVNESEYMSISIKAFGARCTVSASCFIETSGQVSEIRFINSCSRQLERRVRKYLSTLVFKPARLGGKPIISQSLFRFGKSF